MWRCCFCYFSCRDKWQLVTHLIQHTGGESCPLRCAKCTEKFSSYLDIKKHPCGVLFLIVKVSNTGKRLKLATVASAECASKEGQVERKGEMDETKPTPVNDTPPVPQVEPASTTTTEMVSKQVQNPVLDNQDPKIAHGQPEDMSSSSDVWSLEVNSDSELDLQVTELEETGVKDCESINQKNRDREEAGGIDCRNSDKDGVLIPVGKRKGMIAEHNAPKKGRYVNDTNSNNDMSVKQPQTVPNTESDFEGSQAKDDFTVSSKRAEKKMAIYSCEHCSYTSKYQWNVVKHEKSHSVLASKCTCKVCSIQYNTEHDLRFHYCEKGRDGNLGKPQTSSGELFSCDVCSFRTTNSFGMCWHKSMHEKKSSNQWHAGEKKEGLGGRKLSAAGRYFCSICEYSSYNRSHVERHELLHKCKKCNCDFPVLSRKRYHTCSDQPLNMESKKFKRPQQPSLLSGTVPMAKYRRKKRRLVAKGRKHSPVKCSSCPYIAWTPWSLRAHKGLHTGIRPYKCAVCNVGFITSGNLSRHTSFVHGSMMVEGRAATMRVGGRSGPQVVSEPSTVPQYKSQRCGYSFRGEKDLLAHKVKNCQYKCEKCNQEFKSSSSLHAHRLVQHSTTPPETSDTGNWNSLINSTNAAGGKQHRWPSQECSESSELPPLLRADQTLSDTGIFPAASTSSRSIVMECGYCGRAFASMIHYRQHGCGGHKAETPFRCSTCGKGFILPDLLHKHSQLCATRDKNHFKTQRQGDNKQNHVESLTNPVETIGSRPERANVTFRETKTDKKSGGNLGEEQSGIPKFYVDSEKIFHCSWCNFATKHRTSVQNHSRIHTGEKPFKCKVCNATFRYAYLVRNHPCGKPEVDNSGRQKLQCPDCTYSTYNISALKTHIKKFKGEQPLQCQKCLQYFHGRMKKHMCVRLTSPFILKRKTRYEDKESGGKEYQEVAADQKNANITWQGTDDEKNGFTGLFHQGTVDDMAVPQYAQDSCDGSTAPSSSRRDTRDGSTAPSSSCRDTGDELTAPSSSCQDTRDEFTAPRPYQYQNTWDSAPKHLGRHEGEVISHCTMDGRAIPEGSWMDDKDKDYVGPPRDLQPPDKSGEKMPCIENSSFGKCTNNRQVQTEGYSESRESTEQSEPLLSRQEQLQEIGLHLPDRRTDKTETQTALYSEELAMQLCTSAATMTGSEKGDIEAVQGSMVRSNFQNQPSRRDMVTQAGSDDRWQAGGDDQSRGYRNVDTDVWRDNEAEPWDLSRGMDENHITQRETSVRANGSSGTPQIYVGAPICNEDRSEAEDHWIKPEVVAWKPLTGKLSSIASVNMPQPIPVGHQVESAYRCPPSPRIRSVSSSEDEKSMCSYGTSATVQNCAWNSRQQRWVSRAGDQNQHWNVAKYPATSPHGQEIQIRSPDARSPTMQKFHKCEHCRTYFEDLQIYIQHAGLHGRPNPWLCNACGFTLSDRFTFMGHMILHGPNY